MGQGPLLFARGLSVAASFVSMGHPRPRPKHLAAKLLKIRQALGLSQPELAKVLGIRETNKNEPPLAILLAYSRAATFRLRR